MCEPATALMGISAVIGGYGALQSGKNAQSAAESEAALYRTQAAARLQKAEYEVEKAQRLHHREQGKSQALQGGTGISHASFYDIAADDAEEASLERAAIRWGAKSEASMLEYQAQSATRRGSDAKSASYINAAGAVVSAFTPMIKSRYASQAIASGVSIGGDEVGHIGNLK